jgi:hypothetical protein
VLTTYASDTHRVDLAGDALVVAAPGTNQAGAMRIVVTPADGQAPTVDQESCGTWSGGTGDPFRQEGAALRIATAGGVTRGITVTKAVWAEEHWRFNVHTWDTAIPNTDTSSPALWIASFDLSAAFGQGARLRPLPWRMCARAVGDVVSFVVWPLADPPPAWGDPRYGGAVRLPAGDILPGRAGWYAGHLQPGASLVYGARSEQPVTAPPDPPPTGPVRRAAPAAAEPRDPTAIPALP